MKHCPCCYMPKSMWEEFRCNWWICSFCGYRLPKERVWKWRKSRWGCIWIWIHS